MRMYVAGEWVEGVHQEELRSPYDSEVIDTVPLADVAAVERAIDAAVRWSRAVRWIPSTVGSRPARYMLAQC